MLADRLRIGPPPETVAVLLFFLIPVVGLVACGWVVWLSGMTVARKIGCSLFTLIGILLQFGVLLVIILAAITVAIGYAPTQSSWRNL